MVGIVIVAVVAGVRITCRSSSSIDIVSYSRSYIVAMSVIEGIVAVEIVVIVVGGQISVMIAIPVAVISVIVWVVVCPSPTIGEAVVIKAVTIVIWTIVVTWPAPIVPHVNTYAPRRWTVVIPIEVGVERIVVAPAAIYVGVETAETRRIVIIIIVVFVIIIVVVDHVGTASAVFCSFCVLNDRFAVTGIVSFGVQQVSGLIVFIYDGVCLKFFCISSLR